ncbi:hypothetical protein ERO13_D12G155133v2 [Gossypium hirsutum]|uniref:Uncharacterized protein n=3 Tax=Gossypium TaxID=3633 RepID=A0A5J5P3H2_GOSBA|nr:hypothetical protein ES319_D12G172700v1 [Gossypium barbadense]KAG4116203.1 hypothetical protein ERO13_D12G155133v2 [Gossypium hirsutum]TYG41518.1 hypothetical protein ES288_D12G181600v1 [Gossypium darwinii]TYI51416.1 hypothetical protein E1A91_D12G174900v1 [Gossypium mustelinum]
MLANQFMVFNILLFLSTPKVIRIYLPNFFSINIKDSFNSKNFPNNICLIKSPAISTKHFLVFVRTLAQQKLV